MSNPDAIVAIADDGTGLLVRWLTTEHWKQEDHIAFDSLREGGFVNTVAGFYYATLSASQEHGVSCNPECSDDCFETEWELGECLYIIR
jgi:hypothetical protein